MIALVLAVLVAQVTPPPAAATPIPPLRENVAPVPSTAAPSGMLPVPHVDRLFALAAAESNAAEMAMAQLALQRSQASEVRSYAQKMIAEHEGLEDAFRPALTRVLGARPTMTLAPGDQLALEHLRTVPVADFDQSYLMAQIGGHVAAVGAFHAEADNGNDAVLKTLARTWLPTVESHLELAVDLTGHIGGGSPFKSGH